MVVVVREPAMDAEKKMMEKILKEESKSGKIISKTGLKIFYSLERRGDDQNTQYIPLQVCRTCLYLKISSRIIL